MKNKINICLCGIFALFLGMTSCTDYLDREPDSVIDADDAYKNYKNFAGFVEEMYHLAPDVMKAYWVSSFNWGEDELITLGNGAYLFGHSVDRGTYRDIYSNGTTGSATFLQRTWSAEGDRFQKDIWGSHWYGIRKCNMGLEALENGLMTDASQDERDVIKGQLHFLRGWFYFNLTTYWGGMPYIDHVLSPTEELKLPRETYLENADKMAADFKAAADLLPVNWDDTEIGRRTAGNNELRPNKIWALSYLGKTYLYASSPLMHQGVNGTPLVYDSNYAKQAADVLGQVLNMVEAGQTQYSLVNFDEYSNLFYTHKQNWLMPGSTEAIMRSPTYGADSFWRQANSYQVHAMATGDGIVLCPTANYVNYYGMANGLPLNHPESGFDKTHPWKDRDPRFYHDIIYDGVKTVRDQSKEDAQMYGYANLHNGGNYMETSTHHSRTGYLNYKFIPLGANIWDRDIDGWGNAVHMHLSWMRLADVYLMYAEAAAQGYGGANGKSTSFGKSAVEAVNTIRERAGVAPVHESFTSSKDEFMKELIRERAVELAFEGHRFNDLRRWLLLTEYPYNIKTVQRFDRAAPLDKDADPKENAVLNWAEEVLVTRNLDAKHYWLPINTDDVKMYPEFYQNPGW